MKLKKQPWHLQTPLKNTITKWSGSDTEDMWYNNIKKHKSKLDRLGWDENSIEYRHNSNGFRTDEFDIRESAMAIGCSFTYGSGLREEDIWPTILSEKLNKHIWNLGISGASFDTTYRMCSYYVIHLNVQEVFLLIPPKSRFEYFNMSEGYLDVMLPRMIKHFDEFVKGYVMDEMIEVNYFKNLDAIRYACLKNDAKLYFLNHDNIALGPPPLGAFPGKARDLIHPGRSYHDEVANSFYNMVK